MKRHSAKLTLVLATLGFISVSHADNGLSGWSVDVRGEYQQFSNNGTTYAETGSNKQFNVSPDFTTGYKVGLGYHVPDKDSDVEIGYRHLNTSDTSSVMGSDLWVIGGSTLGPATWAQGKSTFDYDSFDLTAGHKVKLSPSFDINYYGGLNYSHLKQELTSQGTGAGGAHFTNETGTTYDGFGPQFGIDGECHPFDSQPGFGVFGGLNTDLLYGKTSSYSRSDNNGTRSSIGIPDENVVVPAVGAEIGLRYNFNYNTMKLGGEIGYSATEYFNVIRDNNNTNSRNNASFQGGFAGVRVTF
ncbi:Lpg1974 family pore-forming outer membrane protein [Aquicella lusitana]|uniref:Major outer membrane protein n=1 Tax=Aquicella lusitana TaxID=254246 RepID=A0A370G105_9COXI|nr:Lpg1974 family pore-forming outer membrane protein [Aquicella lusitana]RDI36676.1 major outer membrane protein [Aquicella lusitana]VVC72544.1 hypothetical protein AQULUS_02560 [Aquicella lusitana]